MIFRLLSRIDILSFSCEIAHQVNARRPYWWQVIIGLDNGLVPSGNKLIPESMLTEFSEASMAELGVNEFSLHFVYL